MCRSMVDIQSPTAEIRRGKKRKKKKKKERNRIKIYMVSLFYRATINQLHSDIRSCDIMLTPRKICGSLAFFSF